MRQIVIKFRLFALFVLILTGTAYFVGSLITDETALVLHLKIVEAGEDEQVHWFIVELQDTKTKERLDVDRFRFAKQIKHTEFADIETNRFDYQELATTASRHFLKRQGKIAKDSPWEPASIIKISGADIVEEEILAVRRTRMVGAELRVEARNISGTLAKLNLHMGTVTTISADFDGLTWDNRDIFCDDTATTMRVGVGGEKYRPYARFPLSSIEATHIISDVDLRVNVTSLSVNACSGVGINHLCVNIQAYNQDGRADPEADSCITRFSRTANDPSAYIENLDFESTGITTFQLPNDANTDVQSALVSTNRFSIAFNEIGSDALFGDLAVYFETIENAGGDEFKLIITHQAFNPSPGPASLVTATRVSGKTPTFTLNLPAYATIAGGYTLASGKTASQIIGVAYENWTNGTVAIFYDDGTYSVSAAEFDVNSGLVSVSTVYNYTLASGKTASQVIGVVQESWWTSKLAVFYNDGTYSLSASDWDATGDISVPTLHNYTLAAGHVAADVIAVEQEVWTTGYLAVFYDDGHYSVSASDWDADNGDISVPNEHNYTLASGKTASQVIGATNEYWFSGQIAIWYDNGGYSISAADWNASANITAGTIFQPLIPTVGFRIQISTNSDFSSPAVDYTSGLATATATSFTVGQAAGSGSYTEGTQSQTLADTTYYWRVKTIDSFSHESAYTSANSGNIAFIVDTISTSVASSVTNTGTTITWTTPENASSILDWGLTSTYSQVTAEIDTSPRVTSHTSSISGVLPCTIYHYRVRSINAALNEATGIDKTFTTTGCFGSASVISESSSTITRADGGTLSLGTGSSISVPTSFAATDATFQAKRLNRDSVITAAPAPSNTSPIGSFFQLSALSNPTTLITSFDNAITVSLSYSGSSMSGLSESSLKIYRWDGSWSQLSGCGINTSLKIVTCTTANFFVFGLFANAAGGGLPLSYFASPAPPAEGFNISINNGDSTTQSRFVTLTLTAGSDISNMSISSNTADLSDATQETYQQTKEWDICSSYGGSLVLETCPSGTYTITAQFYTTYGGQPSPLVSAQITYEPTTPEIIIPKEEELTSETPTTTDFSRNLTLQSIGEDVQRLQEYLNNAGFLLAESGPGSPGQETTYFGSLTKAALIRFQNANEETILHPLGLLKGTGFFGASTIFAISNKQSAEQPFTDSRSLVGITRNLVPGDFNEDVKTLQELLATDPDIYPEALVTSYYGPLTTKAVQRFQLRHSVVSSAKDPGYGYAGPKTRAKLREVFL